VAGIGINVNQTIDDFPEELRASAGSLAMATARRIDRSKLAIALLRNLESGVGPRH
jgi:BirA family biotin operon repressor/biotin-[acetyl-CoA-carboxylase] ligase